MALTDAILWLQPNQSQLLGHPPSESSFLPLFSSPLTVSPPCPSFATTLSISLGPLPKPAIPSPSISSDAAFHFSYWKAFLSPYLTASDHDVPAWWLSLFTPLLAPFSAPWSRSSPKAPQSITALHAPSFILHVHIYNSPRGTKQSTQITFSLSNPSYHPRSSY